MHAAERQRAGDQDEYYCARSQAIEFFHRCYDLGFREWGAGFRDGARGAESKISLRSGSAIEF